MEVPVEETIGMWEDRPVETGQAGLLQLQTDEFDGLVEGDRNLRAFYVRGRIVHVAGGTVDELADDTLTAHQADDAGVAMLAAMRTLAPEARARYYTHKTALDAVDETLRSGGFTGYVCLAEQVVSGAYFLVYHNGKRMPVAYVGAARRIVTGQDAFELAADEVGIYEVFPTQIEIRTIDAGPEEVAAPPPPDPTPETPQIDLQLDVTGTSTDAYAGASDAMAATEQAPAEVEEPTPASTSDPTPSEAPTAVDGSVPVSDTAPVEPEAPSGEPATSQSTSVQRPANEAVTSHLQGRLMALEERRRELERERDELMREVARVETTVEERDDRITRLTAEYEGTIGEQADTIDAQQRQIEQLQAQVANLEQTVAHQQAELEGEELIETEELPPRAAFEQTNLFIRYRDKAGPSLRDFRMQNAAIGKVRENLAVEYHTHFDAARTTVEGESFEAYLHGATEYRFIQWVTGDLLALIEETGNRGAMGPLFEAVTAIDRVELYGEVSASVATEDEPISRPFDIIARNQVGDPLLVADVNTTPAATTRAMTESMTEKLADLAPAIADIAAGFYVTESFYDPGALQVIADQISGGIIPRTSKRSYVRMGRGRGFHLCLTERRGEQFYLNVPDL
ncbi:MAG: hypothetical protein RI544_02290 [Haloquadratum sp.]|jgi:hypothetical protein|nr:hypothetical protein [Haloferacaceae archaeon]MDR9444971.1 hypothetical protein [Haloquadratum sp.]